MKRMISQEELAKVGNLEPNVSIPSGTEPHTLTNFKYKDDYYEIPQGGVEVEYIYDDLDDTNYALIGFSSKEDAETAERIVVDYFNTQMSASYETIDEVIDYINTNHTALYNADMLKTSVMGVLFYYLCYRTYAVMYTSNNIAPRTNVVGVGENGNIVIVSYGGDGHPSLSNLDPGFSVDVNPAIRIKRKGF